MQPNVSVIIPTRNSIKTIELTVKSIINQTYKDLEIIVGDSKSTDGTIEICKKLGCKVLITDWKLLGAQYQAFKASSGNYILILSSDHILDSTAIERSMPLFDKYDMLCLEEKAYSPTTLIEKMFEADRRLTTSEFNVQIDPVHGTLIPRFYKRYILEKAFNSIPDRLLPIMVAGDDAVLYYEASKHSNKVTLVPNGMLHNETATLAVLWKKNYRYGKTLRQLVEDGYYGDFLRKKYHHFRKTQTRVSKDKLMSSLLLLLKAPAYLIGFYL